jgi:hypothetical protein
MHSHKIYIINLNRIRKNLGYDTSVKIVLLDDSYVGPL